MTTVTEFPLSTQMREGTPDEHERAEASRFMAALVDGKVNATGYAAYLARLAPIYAALETVAVELADDPIAAQVVDPVLFRSQALRADLAYWSDGEGLPADTPAVRDYVARIQSCLTYPHRYLAHHYTRYLGDLSGGQAIAVVLKKTFGLKAKEGIAFYDFAAVSKPKLYKDDYRGRLDAAVMDAHIREAVVDEVRLAFDLNGALFAELSAHLPEYTR